MPTLQTRASPTPPPDLPTEGQEGEHELHDHHLEATSSPAGKKTGRSRNDRQLTALGARLGRVEQMQGNLVNSFAAFWLSKQNDEMELHAPDAERQARNERLIEWCTLAFPPLQNVIEDPASTYNELESYFRMIDVGRTEGKNNDTAKLKAWVANPEMLELQPPLRLKAKDDRGFRHHQLGEMLCPIGVDWDDNDVRLNLQMPGAAVSHQALPRFLYPDMVGDPDDIEEGMFLNPMLVKVFKLLIIDTQYGQNLTLDEKIARSMTPQAFAYVAVQLRFALSSDPRIDTKVFDYTGFYNFLVELLSDESGQSFMGDLRDHYANELTSESQDVIGQVDCASDAVLKKLRRQRAKKERQRQREVELARSNPSSVPTTSRGAPTKPSAPSKQPAVPRASAPPQPSPQAQRPVNPTASVASGPAARTDVDANTPPVANMGSTVEKGKKRAAEDDGKATGAPNKKAKPPLANITNAVANGGSNRAREQRTTRSKNPSYV